MEEAVHGRHVGMAGAGSDDAGMAAESRSANGVGPAGRGSPHRGRAHGKGADGEGADGRGEEAAMQSISRQPIREAERVAADDGREAHRVVRRSRASLEQRAAWAARRAAFHWNDVGSGNADGSADGRWQAHVWLLQCEVCGDLVDWRAACNRAKRDGRMEFVAGDGCSGRGAGCGGRGHRRGRHGEGQRSMRERLEEGRRMLVEWPARRDTRAWIRAEEQRGR
jgi:hypothetical protein